MNERDRRNLNPHKAARVALLLYGREYAAQNGGSMDFWDKLSEGRKQTCREELEKIEKAPKEPEKEREGKS
jgi:hypothetical protein